MTEAKRGTKTTPARRLLSLASVSLILASFGSGCTGEAYTGFDLSVVVTEIDGLDRLDVSLFHEDGELFAGPFSRPDEDRALEETESVVVLVPEELDGDTLRILVEGFAGAASKARGEAEVTVRVGVIQEVVVSLESSTGCDDVVCEDGQVCVPRRGCVSGCLIEEAFREPGSHAPGNPCLVCRPDESTDEWSPEPVGTTCGTNMVCSPEAHCVHDRLPVSVTLAGNGDGVVSSSPAGIDCGFQCGALFSFGEEVTLTAVSTGEASAFTGWSGDECSGSDPTCVFTVERSVQVVAEFGIGVQDLTVSVEGSGEGRVTSADGAIECGDGMSLCAAALPAGEQITLTWTAAAGSEFAGWGGACQGGGETCEITMSGERHVSARFDRRMHLLEVLVEGGGVGSVSSGDGRIDCGVGGAECSAEIGQGDVVTLVAQPAEGSSFMGWGGDCDAAGHVCELTVDSDKSVTGTFGVATRLLEVDVAGSGGGSVSSADGTITCGEGGGYCVGLFAQGQVVALEASPRADSVFAAWTGACEGAGADCEVVMTDDQSAGAIFDLAQYTLSVGLSGDGEGTIESSDGRIECGPDASSCQATYTAGDEVVLTVTTGEGSELFAWGGACQGTPGSSCALDVTGDAHVSADVRLRTHKLHVGSSGSGGGVIRSQPEGIDCGDDCGAVFKYGVEVTLSAEPDRSSEFKGWGGDCAGVKPSCTLVMTRDMTANAVFDLKEYALTVEKVGNGEGHVSSQPAGIDCGRDCRADFVIGELVELEAEPSQGSVFAGWGGACEGAGSTCELTVGADLDVTASFTLQTYSLEVSVGGDGAGTVTSDDGSIDCGHQSNACQAVFDHGVTVVLSAEAADGSVFSGFGGECAEIGGQCVVTMLGDASVRTDFDLQRHLLSVVKEGDGGGQVLSSPSGIDCGASCGAEYSHGTQVTLEALPNEGSDFDGWYGEGCFGAERCVVTMDRAREVTAVFVHERVWLTVEKAGGGEGTIVSSPNGIDCGEQCAAGFEENTQVTLTASAKESSTFEGWSGACSGTGLCVVVMSEARHVTASFRLRTRTLSVSRTGSGSGSVVSSPSGIDCGAQCGATYDHYTSVTLTPQPSGDSEFAGWFGACSGTGPCTVEMTRDRSVTAAFRLRTETLHVTRSGDGVGTVTSEPTGIDCGSTCAFGFQHYTTVTLTASVGAASAFGGWSGEGCSGTGTCVVQMTKEREVTATFERDSYGLTVVLEGTGEGGVVSDPEGIECAPACSALFPYGSYVDLTALPVIGSRFVGWSAEHCGERAQCQVVMDGDEEVTATFGIEWEQVSAGSFHTCGIDTTGRMWCWGRGASGQLGHGHFEDRSTPVQVSGGHADWIEVSAGLDHTCGIRASAISSGGSLWCWGAVGDGRLGSGDSSNQATPRPVTDVGEGWKMVSAGHYHTCGVSVAQGSGETSAWCWGRGSFGRLGHDRLTSSSTPALVHGGHTDWLEVSAGMSHSCGLRSVGGAESGSIWCWGRAEDGRLGDGQEDVDRSRPEMIVGGMSGWLQISAGREHSCALRSIGPAGQAAWCWGQGRDGRLGDGTEETSFEPVRVLGPADWASVSAGDFHTCGARADGDGDRLWCWGRGTFGRLGHGSDESSEEPVEVAGDRADWRGLSAGGAHNCAVRGPASGQDGGVWCWGYGLNGRLGHGSTGNESEPVLVR